MMHYNPTPVQELKTDSNPTFDCIRFLLLPCILIFSASYQGLLYWIFNGTSKPKTGKVKKIVSCGFSGIYDCVEQRQQEERCCPILKSNTSSLLAGLFVYVLLLLAVVIGPEELRIVFTVTGVIFIPLTCLRLCKCKKPQVLDEESDEKPKIKLRTTVQYASGNSRMFDI